MDVEIIKLVVDGHSPILTSSVQSEITLNRLRFNALSVGYRYYKSCIRDFTGKCI